MSNNNLLAGMLGVILMSSVSIAIADDHDEDSGDMNQNNDYDKIEAYCESMYKANDDSMDDETAIENCISDEMEKQMAVEE